MFELLYIIGLYFKFSITYVLSSKNIKKVIDESVSVIFYYVFRYFTYYADFRGPKHI